MDMKLEVVVVPVSDVDRAKQFYQSIGFRLDVDLMIGDERIVQFTPPGSPVSIHSRSRHHPSCSWQWGQPDARCFEYRGGAKRVDSARRESERGVPRRWWFLPRSEIPRRRPRPRTPLVLLTGLIQRSRRQPLVAPGDHDAPSGPWLQHRCPEPERTSARDRRASR